MKEKKYDDIEKEIDIQTFKRSIEDSFKDVQNTSFKHLAFLVVEQNFLIIKPQMV